MPPLLEVLHTPWGAALAPALLVAVAIAAGLVGQAICRPSERPRPWSEEHTEAVERAVRAVPGAARRAGLPGAVIAGLDALVLEVRRVRPVVVAGPRRHTVRLDRLATGTLPELVRRMAALSESSRQRAVPATLAALGRLGRQVEEWEALRGVSAAEREADRRETWAARCAEPCEWLADRSDQA